MFLVTTLSFVIGWFLGGSRSEYRRTLGIATALKNPGLAMIVATARFPGTGVASSVAAYFVIQIVVTSLTGKLLKQTA